VLAQAEPGVFLISLKHAKGLHIEAPKNGQMPPYGGIFFSAVGLKITKKFRKRTVFFSGSARQKLKFNGTST